MPSEINSFKTLCTQANEIMLPKELRELLKNAPELLVPQTREDLLNWSMGRKSDETDWTVGNRTDMGSFAVEYPVQFNGTTRTVLEANVVKCRNGISVNYPEPSMRRRDPNAMVIADQRPTDKPRFHERFGKPFDQLREETFAWLAQSPLIVMPFYSGPEELGYGSLLVCPKNAAFFAAMMADMQGFIPNLDFPKNFILSGTIVYAAPVFRHTHLDGKQVVVHERVNTHQNIFSYNLYPGPSAKKGIYSCLIDRGEKEGWVTNHCAAVTVETPYDNTVTFLHEGASGGGKTEMLEHLHRRPDGRLLLGTNGVTGEKRYMTLPTACKLYPITDDMAVAHPRYSAGKKKMVIADAEKGWFTRTDLITGYGTDPHLEELCINAKIPLLYLNHYAAPGSMALLWEHIEDAPGKRCPNPRVIIPHSIIPNRINGAAEVNIRSFGVRTPFTHHDKPNYGIIGLFHVLPPSLAWLWRIVSPRGTANPSIQASAAKDEMASEGVGSYWPFCTGKRVTQANLLLNQIRETPETRNILIPNQFIGAWKVGFMSSWITREYLARRGNVRFKPDQLVAARSPLLGSVPWHMQVEGTLIPRWILEVDKQPEVGTEIYDKGASILQELFKKELENYRNEGSLDPTARKIIDCCFDNGSHEDFENLL